MKIGRNDKCYCGSGKKYKYCCLNREGLYIPENLAKELMIERQIKEHIHFVPSVEYQGHRMRAIWNRIYPRPLKETFHEFIIAILKETLGEQWHKSQIGLVESERHVLMKWFFSNYEFSKRVITKGEKVVDEYGNARWGSVPSGEAQAIMQLAYDVFCLQQINKLPDFLVMKLKDKVAFQSARYEIAVASIMARAGFEIEFLDDKVKGKKHCEFIATRKNSGIKIGIEAKSRRRKGVLNEIGEYNYNSEIRGDMWHLFRDARSQKPEGLPYLIFIDMNIRPTPDIPLDKKPWNKDLIKMVNDYGDATEENPDPYNAVILTNYSYYYTGQDVTSKGEYFFVIAKIPETKISDEKILEEVFESVYNYNKIPEEV